MAAKSKDAGTIMELAKNRYDRSKEMYEQKNKECVESMKSLDEQKMIVWDSFSAFLDLFERIKNRPELTGSVEKDELKLTKLELEDIKLKSTQLKNAIAAGAGAAVGAATGTLGATIALGGIGLSAFCAMGVGDAIAVTASFASVNIALYGVGAVFWPAAVIAAAATAVGALFSSVHGNRQLAEAAEVEKQVDIACSSFLSANDYLNRLKKCSDDAQNAIHTIYTYYSEKLKLLNEIVDRHEDYLEFSQEEKNTLEVTTLLVVILKKLTQTSLLIKKDSQNTEVIEESNSENGDNEPKEELSEINSEQVKSVVMTSMEQFNSIVSDNISEQEEEEIVYEEIVVSGHIKTEYDRKKITFTGDFGTGIGTYTFNKCRLCFDDNARWKINSGEYHFKDCVFEGGNLRNVKITITGKSTKVVFDRCRWVECEFNHDGMYDVNGDCKLVIRDSSVIGCKNTFIKITSVKKAEIDNCFFDRHCNRLFELVTVDGLKISNCTFNDFTGNDEYIKKALSSFVSDTNENAVIFSSYAQFRVTDCIFSNSTIPIISGCALQERMDWINCTFKNIHFGEKRIGRDRKEYYSDRAFKMPGGTSYIKDCELIDVAGLSIGSIGDFCNAISQIENSSFIGCRGVIDLNYTLVLNCIFEECSYVKSKKKTSEDDFMDRVAARLSANSTNLLNIVGMAGNGDRKCLGEISGCRFTDCRADDYIIMPYNAMHRREISISVNNNIFEGCEAGNEELISLVSYFMGQPEGKMITASNNTFSDKVQNKLMVNDVGNISRGARVKVNTDIGQACGSGAKEQGNTNPNNAEIAMLKEKLEELTAEYEEVKEQIRELQKKKSALKKKMNS